MRPSSSSGLIALYATTVTAQAGAYLMANGGGGASGTDASSGQAAGGDPSAITPTIPAKGGAAMTNGNGGDGFAGITAPTTGLGASGVGGGGGGGGAGAILLSKKVSAGLTASPAAVLW